MAQLLGNVAVGSTVYLNESGNPQPYLVVHQGLPSSLYDNSCNGTWLWRKNSWGNSPWSTKQESSGPAYLNTYLSSKIYNLSNLGYKNDLNSVVKNVKIPYNNGYPYYLDNVKTQGYRCKFFLLSAVELGATGGYNGIPADGSKLSYFDSGSGASSKRISNNQWWTRSPDTDSSGIAWKISSDGSINTMGISTSFGINPAMIMPTNLIVDDSNNVTSIIQPMAPSTITVPSIAMQQQNLPISWTAVSISGADVTYQLQRNADNGGWTTIYTGADTSYTDTVGTWTQVQYQVATVVLGVTSSYTQSSIIPVFAPSVLVISGQDGNLGTLTSNLPYTVSSNTGNPISLTRTVNGAQVVTLTVESGFAYSIPIADLPTGTGTIQITASVESGSETITQTRTWTYYKTPINIPSTGGVAQLTQNGQNIWPTTIADAVQAPAYLGGNLNAALNKLGQAALYTKIGSSKYSEVTVDLSKVSVGDEVLIPENGVMIPYIVVQIGNPDVSMYDSSCDGVWLLRKDCVATGQWNSSNVNTLSGSTIMSTMAGYVANYGSEVQSAIKTVKIPYCVGGGNTTVNTLGNGLECKIFPLSGYEVGFSTSDNQYFPVDGAKLSYFLGGTGSSANQKRIAYLNDSATYWWLRSPYTPVTGSVWNVGSNGNHYNWTPNASYGVRPAMILPPTFTATYYVDSSNNIHPSQEYTTGGSITDVFGYDVPICQYEAGSYVGTGAYGSSNRNSLTFGFEPKIVFISCASGTVRQYGILIYNIGGFSISGNYGSQLTQCMPVEAVFNQNSISFYSWDAVKQMNSSGYSYNYVAIG